MLYLSFILLAIVALSGLIGLLLSAGLAASGGVKLLSGIVTGVLAVAMARYLLRNV